MAKLDSILWGEGFEADLAGGFFEIVFGEVVFKFVPHFNWLNDTYYFGFGVNYYKGNSDWVY